jgi:hypothetical protein
MIDQSLLKSNFLGRDGFRWWIGQIPPIGSQGGQAAGAGWGNRYKVRILGYHPYNETELPNDDLPWAQALIPTTAGSGAANVATDVKLQPGDVVFGFFLDGDNAQIPVIMSTFGRTSQVPTKDWAGPFQPFTGYTDSIKSPSSDTLKKDESNEQNAKSQKSPRHVSPKQAKDLGNGEVSYFSAIGDTVQLASKKSGQVVNKISSEVGNFVKKVQDILAIAASASSYAINWINREIDRVTKKVQSIATGLVSNMVNGLFNKLAPIINKGLKLLYKFVYNLVFTATLNPAIAHLAGVAAQKAMVIPVKALQSIIPCITNQIIGTLGGVVKSLLQSIVGNVQNFASCAANQFTGSLVNDIIGKVSSGLAGPIAGIQQILQFFGGFSIQNTLRNAVDGLSGLDSALNCGQSASADSGVTQWVIGSGPKNVPPTPFSTILNNANIAAAVGSSLSFGSSIPNGINPCSTSYPTTCGSPTINIFGGGGSGCSAVPLLGALVGADNSQTGSMIGVNITNPGSGYTFPPFVEITDECGQGYGALARSTINDAGQVTGIYLVSEGENYPAREIKNYTIGDILIFDPGIGYSQGDTATDDYGNDYDLQITNGAVTKVTPIQPLNTIDFQDRPILKVKSNTGSGALIQIGLTDIRPPQGEVKRVIDCVLA